MLYAVFVFFQIKLLFDLASLEPETAATIAGNKAAGSAPSSLLSNPSDGSLSPRRYQELQMQMLYVIGRVTEVRARDSGIVVPCCCCPASYKLARVLW